MLSRILVETARGSGWFKQTDSKAFGHIRSDRTVRVSTADSAIRCLQAV